VIEQGEETSKKERETNFVVPFVLSVVQVVETLLQPLQLQGEARSQFLKLDVLCVIENVSAIKAATIKEKSEEKNIMFGLQCNQGTKGKREEKKKKTCEIEQR